MQCYILGFDISLESVELANEVSDFSCIYAY